MLPKICQLGEETKKANMQSILINNNKKKQS